MSINTAEKTKSEGKALINAAAVLPMYGSITVTAVVARLSMFLLISDIEGDSFDIMPGNNLYPKSVNFFVISVINKFIRSSVRYSDKTASSLNSLEVSKYKMVHISIKITLLIENTANFLLNLNLNCRNSTALCVVSVTVNAKKNGSKHANIYSKKRYIAAIMRNIPNVIITKLLNLFSFIIINSPFL